MVYNVSQRSNVNFRNFTAGALMSSVRRKEYDVDWRSSVTSLSDRLTWNSNSSFAAADSKY
jgi:hypothetical protein